MKNLVISMEATSDLPKEIVKENNFEIINMDFVIDGKLYNSKKDTINSTLLYEKMKKGIKTSTSQVNEDIYYNHFKTLIEKGKKVLHLAFSSGLSNTYNNAIIAKNKINKEFGEVVYIVDSLSACSGQGLFGILVSDFAKTNNSINAIIKFANKLKQQISHIFTVDNLKYLANGGRIKTSTAIVGNILNIKPVMKMDSNGQLVSYGKVISRKKSLNSLYNKFKNTTLKEQKLCFVSHADCIKDAEYIASLIQNDGYRTIITNLSPIIGCHSGPGTLAIFYLSENRN